MSDIFDRFAGDSQPPMVAVFLHRTGVLPKIPDHSDI